MPGRISGVLKIEDQRRGKRAGEGFSGHLQVETRALHPHSWSANQYLCHGSDGGRAVVSIWANTLLL